MPDVDRAARRLAVLVTGGDDWDRKSDRLRDTYRDQIEELVALSGAAFPDADQAPQPPVIDTAAILARLDAVDARLADIAGKTPSPEIVVNGPPAAVDRIDLGGKPLGKI